LDNDFIWNERHVLKIHVGEDRRIVFDAFEAEVGLMGTACCISKRRATAAVPRISRKRKGPAPPTFFTSSRGSSDNENNKVHLQLPHFLSLHNKFPALTNNKHFLPSMASDTLIPDTRVLAIASHVRLTQAESQDIQLIYDR
jgi:hypothetical protein